MSLFKGEQPQLGTTVIQSSFGVDTPLTVKNDAGSTVMSVSNTGTVTAAGKLLPSTFTVKGISPIVTPATAGTAWIAPFACKVVSIKEAHSAGTAGVTINLRKITDTSAPSAAAGATVKELLSSALDANSTANTVVTGSLSATASDYTFAAGNRMCWNASGTLTAYVGEITVEFQAV